MQSLRLRIQTNMMHDYRVAQKLSYDFFATTLSDILQIYS